MKELPTMLRLARSPLLLLLLCAGVCTMASAGVAKKNSKTKKDPVVAQVLATPLSEAQLEAAKQVVLGDVPCNLGAHVQISEDTQSSPGHFVVELARKKYFMEPVPTSTGAVRLEDAKSGVVLLQLGTKSMLMDQKLGKRLADGCTNPDQLRMAQEVERNPPRGLFDNEVVSQGSTQSNSGSQTMGSAPSVPSTSAGAGADTSTGAAVTAP